MSFVMCPPDYISTEKSNNIWMSKLPKAQREIDSAAAVVEYWRLRRFIESQGVEVLEIPPDSNCQDQPFTANCAVAIDPVIVLANFKAAGRKAEEEPTRRFFESMDYRVIQPPHWFEGEADCKKIRDGLYFGGFGSFSSMDALEWIAEQCNIDIVPLHIVNPYLYHLDCGVFVIDEENAIITKECMDKESFKLVEQHINCHVTEPAHEKAGITNSVRIPGKPIILTGIYDPDPGLDQEAVKWMQRVFDQYSLIVVSMDLSEFEKSGADLSCCVMHLDF